MPTTTPVLSDTNKFAFQHNHLIRQPLKLTPLEAKIFLLALRCVHYEAKELPPISIPLRDVMAKADGGKDFQQITQACRNLLTKRIQLIPVDVTTPRKKQRWHEANILQDIGIDPAGVGRITGTFTQAVKPYLVELTGNFSLGEIATLITLTNPNTHRLYWLLKSWDGIGRKRYEMEELRQLLFEGEALYPTFYDFKRYVLDPAVATFKGMEWHIGAEPVKTGKKVTTIDFTIPKLHIKLPARADTMPAIQTVLPFEGTLPRVDDSAPNRLPEKFSKVYSALGRVWQLTGWQVEAVKSVVGGNEMKLEKVRDVMRILNAEKAAIDNLAAALWAKLKKEFSGLTTSTKPTK